MAGFGEVVPYTKLDDHLKMDFVKIIGGFHASGSDC